MKHANKLDSMNFANNSILSHKNTTQKNLFPKNSLKNKERLINNKTFEYFQNERFLDFEAWRLIDNFWQKDVDMAENFLDKKFPEIRQIFKLGIEDKRSCYEKLGLEAVEAIQSSFYEIRSKIVNAMSKSWDGSVFAKYKSSNCYKRENKSNS